MTNDPGPGQPGHSSGTASLRVHDPNSDDGLFDVVCPACGDDATLSYAEVSPALQALRGPWPHEKARAKLEYHCGYNTLAVQLGLHQD